MTEMHKAPRASSRGAACRPQDAGVERQGLGAPGCVSVLVVDDEASVAGHLADGLSLLGFRTSAVGSASQALACLASDPGIGVVVTDIRMPGGNGFALARDILAGQCSAQPVEVIFITGHASPDDATEALQVGVRDVLRKPFRLADAARAVERALGEVRLRRGADAPAQRLEAPTPAA